jgi:cytochrome c peroxidase
MSFTPSGDLVVGEIGEDKEEEITYALRGRHHGWPYVEGTNPRNEWTLPGSPKPPIFVYSHDYGMAVIGGYVYGGDALPELKGKYVFADFLSGRICALDLPATDHDAPLTHDDLVELGRWPQLFTTLGRDHSGNVYVGGQDGKVRKIVPASAGDVGGERAALDVAQARSTFAAEPSYPQRDDITAEEVELGRMLFSDPRLSSNGAVSCATCHQPDNFGQDGLQVSTAADGTKTARNTPTVFNAYRQPHLRRDYSVDTVEAQALASLLNEHGLRSEEKIGSMLSEIAEYEAPFRAAYPKDADPRTATRAARALGAYLRKLKTTSRWETFLDGDDAALTDAEKAGLQTFLATGCASCHQYRTLGLTEPRKLGQVYPWEGSDLGREGVTGDEADRHMFRVSSLLNVEKTAPYYHDGSIATLEEAVANMAWIQLGRELSEDDVTSIVTFLRALTGEPSDGSD